MQNKNPREVGFSIPSSNPEYYVNYISGGFSPDAKYVIAVGNSEYARGDAYLWEWESGWQLYIQCPPKWPDKTLGMDGRRS